MRQLLSHTVHASKKHPMHVGFLFLLLLFTCAVLTILSRTSNSFAAGAPPINTSRPTISGTAAVGQILSVDDGIWTGLPTYTYQWRSCDSTGNSCANIGGATNNTYTLQSSDASKTVRAVVTATNVDGFDTSTSDQSQLVLLQLGDLNSDGIINIFDLGIFLGHWQSGSSPAEDFNSDGIVNQTDLNTLLGLYIP